MSQQKQTPWNKFIDSVIDEYNKASSNKASDENLYEDLDQLAKNAIVDIAGIAQNQYTLKMLSIIMKTLKTVIAEETKNFENSKKSELTGPDLQKFILNDQKTIDRVKNVINNLQKPNRNQNFVEVREFQKSSCCTIL